MNLPDLKQKVEIEYDIVQARKDFMDKAVTDGFVISLPKENELQVDIDSDNQLKAFENNFNRLCQSLHQDIYQVRTQSKSGKGFHIRVLMPWPLEPVERIAWQACLGSDPVREILSLIRFRRGDTIPTLFLETKEYQNA